MTTNDILQKDMTTRMTIAQAHTSANRNANTGHLARTLFRTGTSRLHHAIRLAVTAALLILNSIGNGAWALTARYYVVNKNGKTIINFSNTTSVPTVHQKIISPLATDYRFYSSLADAQTDASTDGVSRPNVLASDYTVSDGETLYVRYSYNLSHGLDIDITGSTWYNISVGSCAYMFYRGTTDCTGPQWNSRGITDTSNYLLFWKLESSNLDPYDVHIYNKIGQEENSTYLLTGLSNGNQYSYYKERDADADAVSIIQSFIITQAPGKSTFQFLGAYNTRIYNTLGDVTKTADAQYYYLAQGTQGTVSEVNINGAWNQQHTRNEIQVTLTPVSRAHKYVVVNSIGTELAVSYSTESTLKIPDDIYTPLVDADTGYRYYATKQDAIDGVNELSVLPSDAFSTIYVRYTYNPDNGILQLDENTVYNIFVNGSYAYRDGTSPKGDSSPSDAGADAYLWTFSGDPYDIRISAKYYPNYYLAGNNTSGSVTWDRTGPASLTLRATDVYSTYTPHSFFLTESDTSGKYILKSWYNDNEGHYAMIGYGASDWPSGQVKLYRTIDVAESNEKVKLQFLAKINVTYKVLTIDKDGLGSKAALTATGSGSAGDPLELPNAFQSPLVKSGSYRYYTEDQFVVSDDGSRYKLKDGAVASTVYPATSGQTFYVTYEYDPDNEEDIKLDGSTWYSFKDNYTSGYYLYSSKTLTYGYYDVSHAASIPDSENDAYYWKFTGEDPYNIIIYNSAIQGYHLTASTTGDGDNRPRLSRDGFTEGYPETWIYLNNSRLVTGPNANNKHFHLFSNFYLGSSLASSINDAARVTLSTPTEKTYTFHIIDRSGHKAIKATGKWPIGVTLNYNAIPKEIRSPYIADETLTFYSQTASETAHTSDTNDRRSTYTFSDGDKLEESPASGDDIYVTYTIDHLSEKQLDFSGTRQYYIQAYDDKFVTKLDLAGGAGWSQEYYHGSLLTAEQIAYHGNNDNAFWRLIGNDPYNVRIKGHAFWWFSQNDKGYVLRFQNVDNNYPNIGVILMPDADNASTFKLLCARHDTDDRWYFRRQSGSSTDVADWIYTGTTNDEQCNFRFYPVIHYRVFNQSGTEAIDWRGPSTFTADGSQVTVSLPAGVRSPLIPAEDFTLHTISKDGEAITAPISRSISDVFVTYTTANMASYVNLVGGSHYNIKQPADSEGSSYYYWYRYHGRINVNNATTTANKNENKYRWELLGNDPYAVEIRNWENTDYQVTANFGNAHGEIYSDQTVRKWTRFLLLGQQGEADNSGKYRMMVSMTRENELNMNSYDWTLSWRKESSTPDDILHPNNFYIPYQTIVEFESDLSYRVINLSGKEAIVYKPESEDVSKTKVLLPDQFKSPLAKEYKYYPPSQMNYDSSTGVFSAKEGATPLSENSDVNSDIIFVTYEYNAEAGVDLSGATSYGMFINGADEKGYRMLGFSPRYQSRTNLPVYTQPLEPRKHYSWYLNGGAYNDPYDVTFKNEYSNRYQYINDKNDNLLTEPNSSSSATHFMILAGSSTDRYEVAYMKNNVLRRLYYYGSSSDNGIYSGTGCKEEKAHETDICQIAFTPLYIFHVINFDGKKVISAPGDLVKGENTTLELPHVISSPLIDHYYYYNATDVTNSEDVYTLNTNATNITTLNQVSGQDIYVFYRQADINENLDLTGQVAYNLKALKDNGSYSFYNAGKDYVWHTSTPEDATADDYLWMITGNDPYNIQFYNVKQGMSVPLTMNSNYTHGGDARLVSVKSLGSNTAANSFIITRGLENHYEVLLAYTSGTSYPSPLSADYFHYLAKQTNDNPTITHNENIYHLTGDNYTIFDIVPARNSELTYIVVNKRGTRALKVTLDAAVGVAPDLPVALKSPYATNFTYHTTQENTNTNLATTTIGGETIYVYYDINTEKASANPLISGGSNGKFFYMNANEGHYGYVNADEYNTAASGSTKVEENDEANGGPRYAWTLQAPNGGDPYDITVRAPYYPTKALGTPQYSRPASAPRRAPAEHEYDLQLYDDESPNVMRFALLEGSNLSGHYALVAARGVQVAGEIYGNMLDYVGCQTDGTLKLLQVSIDNVDDAAQLQFEDYELKQQYTYYIVDAQNKSTVLEVATTAVEGGINVGGMASSYVPDVLKRKGAKLVYFDEHATNAAQNTTTPVNVYTTGYELFQLGFNTNIYVGYEIDEEDLGFKYSGTLDELSSLTDGDLEDLNWNLWLSDRTSNSWTKNYFKANGDGGKINWDGLTSTPSDDKYFWAFFGDPYRMSVINKSTGKNALLAVKKLTVSTSYDTSEGDIYVSSDLTTYKYYSWGYAAHVENGNSSKYAGQMFLNVDSYKNLRHYIDGRNLFRVITGLGEDQTYYFVPLVNWTYHVINLSGRQAITAKARGIGTGYTASLPDIVKARFAENYTYYNDANTTVTDGVRTFTGSNQTSFTNTIDGEDIYVKYTVTDKWKTVAEIPGHGNLNGTTYTMAMQMSNYVGYDENRTPMVQADGSSTDSRNGNWIIKANHTESGYDPYDITIASFARPDHLVAIGTYGENMTFTDDESLVQKFILYNTTDANPYRFLAANSASESGNTYAYLRCGSEHGVYISRDKTATDAETAVNLYHNTPTYIYHIYNLSDEEAIRLNATGISNTHSTTLEVPKAIRSQLIDTWHFYSDASRTTPLTSIENLPFNSHVYIDYDYVNHTRGLIDLGGETFYNINFVEGERYWLPDGSNTVKTYTTSADKINGTTDFEDDPALWRIVGSDPYGIVFENASLDSYVSDRAVDATYYNRRYRVNMSNTKTASSTAKYSLVMSEADGNDFELIVNRPCDGGDNVLSLEINAEGRVTYKAFNNSNTIYFGYGSDKPTSSQAQIHFTPRSSDYLYNIINLSGEKALVYTGKGMEGKNAKNLPPAVQSPMAQNFKFYQKSQFDINTVGGVTTYTLKSGEEPYELFPPTTNADGETIVPELYVLYEPKTVEDVNLEGGRYYYLKAAGKYAHTDSYGTALDVADNPTKTAPDVDWFMWVADANNDPYNVRLQEKEYIRYLSAEGFTEESTDLSLNSSGTVQRFCLLPGNGSRSDLYTMVAASGDGITDNMFAYVGYDGEALKLLRGEELGRTTARVQVELEVPKFNYTYKVVNHAGEIAIQYTEEQKSAADPALPNAIKSPFADVTGYYLVGQYNVTTGTPDTYALKSNQKTLEDVGGLPYADTDIYVEYVYNGTATVDLTGNKRYNLMIDDNVYLYNSGSTLAKETSMDDDKRRTTNYQWTLNSSVATEVDPYRLSITNVSETGTTVSKYIIFPAEDGKYVLMQSNITDDGTEDHPYHYFTTDLDAQTGDAKKAKVQFTGIPVNVTYYVINLNDFVVTHNTETQYGGDPLKLPTIIKSPLVEQSGGHFSYYHEAGTTVASNKKVSSIGTLYNDNFTLGYENGTLNVYVKYTYNNANSSIDLSGKSKFHIINGNYYLRNTVPSDRNDLQWRSKTTILNDLGNPAEEVEVAALNGFEPILWELIPATNNTPDPYAVVVRKRNGYKLHYQAGYNDTDKKIENGAEKLMTYNNNTNGDASYQFALLGGESDIFRFMAVAYSNNYYDMFVNEGQVYQYLEKNDNFVFVNVEPHSDLSDAGIQLKLEPADLVDVMFHLTTHITGKELTYEKKDVPVGQEITIPDYMRRKFVDYNPFVAKYYAKGADEETTDNNALRYPLADSDKGYVHIYIDYTVKDYGEEGGIPFRRMAKDKATVDALLDKENGVLETVFDLSSYEKLNETLYTGLKRKDYLYFMVMNTNSDNSRGKQYFLRREDNGRISWLNNDYKLTVEPDAQGHTYSRQAESYRKNDHDPFQEKHWLWCFAGDPYDMYIYNINAVVEETFNNATSQTQFVATHRDHMVNWMRLSDSEYAVNTPGYAEAEPTSYRWGLAEGKGTNSDQTFSLMAGQMEKGTDNKDHFDPNLDDSPLYWKMQKSKVENTEEVLLTTRSESTTELDYNISVLPYVPVRYEDVELVIRRDDEIKKFQDDYSGYSGITTRADLAANSDAQTAITNMKTGLHRLYFAAADRVYAAGDNISKDDMPVDVKRAFCDYTFYTNVWKTEGAYTVTSGPYRGDPQYESDGTTYKLDDNKEIIYNYYDTEEDALQAANGTTGLTVASPNAPQRVYVKYKVTEDIFLTEDALPSIDTEEDDLKAEVNKMANNNDHVFFMDFTDNKSEEGYDQGQHAYFSEGTTFEEVFRNTFNEVDYNYMVTHQPEKLKWNASKTDTENDTEHPFNDCEFKTTKNRMESEPERLKWYFVGDPYSLQVFCTKKPGYNLARFDQTETNYRFVIDCVHLRKPQEQDGDPKDERTTVKYYEDELGTKITDVQNPNYGEFYYKKFKWEMVPAASQREGTFALRFKADNEVMQYRNVYYYLVHDGTRKDYYATSASATQQKFPINLDYDPKNARQLKGKYLGYHEANGDDAVIRLVKPAKVFVSAYKDEDESGTFTTGDTKQTTDELSEYFGIGETLKNVPQHLRRKYVKYPMLRWYDTSNSDTEATFDFTLAKEKLNSQTDCTEHPLGTDGGPYDKRLVATSITDPQFKLDVLYTLDDMTKDEKGGTVHMFTPTGQYNSTTGELTNATWLDIMVGWNNWLYYDKTRRNQDGSAPTDFYTYVSNFNGRSGWSTGLKGLHWALVGDPYSFIAINRRQYDDWWADGDTHAANPNAKDQFLVAYKDTRLNDLKTGSGKDEKILIPKDSTAWVTKLAEESTITATTETSGLLNNSSTTVNTHWSFIWKKTGSDGYIRTASLKTTTEDPCNGQTGNQTNNFYRLGYYDYTAENQQAGLKSKYITFPFSLETKESDIATAIIRTAVVEDDDDAKNDCFDANVRIYQKDGTEVKAYKDRAELRYGNAIESLPVTLRRYGCSYTCYIGDYAQLTDAQKSTNQVTTLLPSDLSKVPEGHTYDHTGPCTEGAGCVNGYPVISYVYTVDDDISPFFTTAEEQRQDQYTWANAYFNWTEIIKTSGVTTWNYTLDIVGYLYDAEGKVQDVIRDWVGHPVTSDGSSTPTAAYGWMNSHSDGSQAYGNEPNQNDDNSEKWAFVGDPYDFQLKNYAKYIGEDPSSLSYNEAAKTINFSDNEDTHWALAVNASGTCYLALLDSDGNILKYVTFDRMKNNNVLSADQQFLYGTGSANSLDPTGNLFDTGGAKSFNLKDLSSYAQYVIYHLVIAHQHSTDYIDQFDSMTAAEKTAAQAKIRKHLAEFLHYKMGAKADNYVEETAFNYSDYASGSDKGMDKYIKYDFKSGYVDADGKFMIPGADETTIKNLLKHASLRDLVTYPVENYNAYHIGIGNKLSVPWYMDRQFCNYTLYQRDVLRSEQTGVQAQTSDGRYIWQNTTTGDIKYTTTQTSPGAGYTPVNDTKWQSVKSTDKNGDVINHNGQPITMLLPGHKDRVVLVDVVYDVDEKQFEFSDRGRNTTKWYQMMTNNEADGLMNFSYKDGIGARPDHAAHYTNNYLWAPAGDPYGFVLHNRYATINGSGWDNVVVTTKEQLPKKASDISSDMPDCDASYTSQQNFYEKRVVHITYDESTTTPKTAGAENAVYEMFKGRVNNQSFLMHPTSAWINIEGDAFGSYYMVHNTGNHKAQLKYNSSTIDLREDLNANWRLVTTPEQLLPYFERAGYVGALTTTAANDNQSYYTELQSGSASFETLSKIRDLVYGGTFYKRDGSELVEGSPRPTAKADLPLRFRNEHLVSLDGRYFRIEAFSREGLDKDGEAINGITGPRFISGFLHKSAMDMKGYDKDTKAQIEGSRMLHFLETDEQHSKFRTFGDLNKHIDALPHSDEKMKERDFIPHPSMRGNIEILPADYDPSSIFYFEPENTELGRYTLSTQGLYVNARAGAQGEGDVDGTGYTKMTTLKAEATPFRIDDIGGAAVTLRTGVVEPAGYDANGALNTWDTDQTNGVEKNLQTNYLCIDARHRYRITVHTDNEMKEISDTYHDWESGETKSYGIQDTKWMLKPVGIPSEWPENNSMPLKLEVQQGEETGEDLDGNPTYHWYSSLYVPYDTRLNSTADIAFTCTVANPGPTSLVMNSVSQLNGMGNPQFIPAQWPVVVRSNNPKTATIKRSDGTTDTKHYVNLYLPNSSPSDELNYTELGGKLMGEYLEQELNIDKTEKAVMVLGLPFKEEGDRTTKAGAETYYAYDYGTTDAPNKPGFYINENWWRGHYGSTLVSESLENDGSEARSFLATARTATEQQRENTYVYHNKMYYVYTPTGTDGTIPRYVSIYFDGDPQPEEEEDEPIQNEVRQNVPWPCDVYDLQGRKVAEQETPATLLKNYPQLSKGVYIFGGRKVIVK